MVNLGHIVGAVFGVVLILLMIIPLEKDAVISDLRASLNTTEHERERWYNLYQARANDLELVWNREDEKECQYRDYTSFVATPDGHHYCCVWVNATRVCTNLFEVLTNEPLHISANSFLQDKNTTLTILAEPDCVDCVDTGSGYILTLLNVSADFPRTSKGLYVANIYEVEGNAQIHIRRRG